MEYTLDYLPEKGYARARIAGFPDVRDARECATGAFALAAANDCTKVLFDGTQLTGETGVSDIHSFYSRLGEFGCDRRMSIAVVLAGPSKRDQFVETVARNRGFGLKVFGTLEDAEVWLMAEPVASA
jgi:hypothetical protein